MKSVDTHCHILPIFFSDAAEVIRRSQHKEVVMNLIGTQYQTSKQAVEMAEHYEGTYASVGLHPTHLFPEYFNGENVEDKTNETEFDYEKYKLLARSKKVIAIGECGLDTYRLPEHADREKVIKKQTTVFLDHVALAQELNLPLVIHVRDAHKKMIEILKREKDLHPNQLLRGVIHCYDSSWENAAQFLELGFYLGWTGVITFPPSKNNAQAHLDRLQALKNCPLDKILLETDAPFLAPWILFSIRVEVKVLGFNDSDGSLFV
jgi:TatD DNase family protein